MSGSHLRALVAVENVGFRYLKVPALHQYFLDKVLHLLNTAEFCLVGHEL